MIAAIALGGGTEVTGQEVVGRRVFADQLVISEPFVEDELSFPSLLHIRRPRTERQPRALVTQIGAELKKRLTTNLEASVSGGLTHLSGDERSSGVGLDNLAVGVKYQFLRDPAHEAVASLALSWDIGGTGRAATGAESFDTISPALLVDKGLGDLPEALAALKPLAIGGLLGADLPTGGHPDVLEWGGLLEYSFPYLQSFVNDLGLPPLLNRLVPLVEVDLQTPLDRGAGRKTTGTVNAGGVWVGKHVQIGVEAVAPLNERSGKNVGVRAFVRFDLDSIVGERGGRPIFGGSD